MTTCLCMGARQLVLVASTRSVLCSTSTLHRANLCVIQYSCALPVGHKLQAPTSVRRIDARRDAEHLHLASVICNQQKYASCFGSNNWLSWMHLQQRHAQTRRQSRPSPSCCLPSAGHQPAPRLRHATSTVTGVALPAISSAAGSKSSSSGGSNTSRSSRSRGSNGLGRGYLQQVTAAGHASAPATNPTGPMRETSLSFANPAGEQLSAKLVDTGERGQPVCAGAGRAAGIERLDWNFRDHAPCLLQCTCPIQAHAMTPCRCRLTMRVRRYPTFIRAHWCVFIPVLVDSPSLLNHPRTATQAPMTLSLRATATLVTRCDTRLEGGAWPCCCCCCCCCCTSHTEGRHTAPALYTRTLGACCYCNTLPSRSPKTFRHSARSRRHPTLLLTHPGRLPVAKPCPRTIFLRPHCPTALPYSTNRMHLLAPPTHTLTANLHRSDCSTHTPPIINQRHCCPTQDGFLWPRLAAELTALYM